MLELAPGIWTFVNHYSAARVEYLFLVNTSLETVVFCSHVVSESGTPDGTSPNPLDLSHILIWWRANQNKVFAKMEPKLGRWLDYFPVCRMQAYQSRAATARLLHDHDAEDNGDALGTKELFELMVISECNVRSCCKLLYIFVTGWCFWLLLKKKKCVGRAFFGWLEALRFFLWWNCCFNPGWHSGNCKY